MQEQSDTRAVMSGGTYFHNDAALKEFVKEIRSVAIEECARVLEVRGRDDLAAAIRALNRAPEGGAMTDTWKSGAEHAEAYFDECMKLRAEADERANAWTKYTDGLEKEIEELREDNRKLKLEIEVLRQSRTQVRAEMKEECAQVAESYKPQREWSVVTLTGIAAAIRALKSNTGG